MDYLRENSLAYLVSGVKNTITNARIRSKKKKNNNFAPK